MCIDKTMEIFDNNAKNGEDENILDNSKWYIPFTFRKIV
jgi:hypothetical protein